MLGMSANKASWETEQDMGNPPRCRVKRHTRIERKTRLKPVNRKRKQSAFARQYGSKARVAWVKSLPCAACGVTGFSENAHLLGNDGAGRKGPYTEIGPLCSTRFLAGCHAMYDTQRSAFNICFPTFNAERVAAETEAAWAARWAGRET